MLAELHAGVQIFRTKKSPSNQNLPYIMLKTRFPWVLPLSLATLHLSPSICNQKLATEWAIRTYIECEVSLIIVEDSNGTCFCLIEVAIEVVWFELKENTKETELRKMRCEM